MDFETASAVPLVRTIGGVTFTFSLLTLEDFRDLLAHLRAADDERFKVVLALAEKEDRAGFLKTHLGRRYGFGDAIDWALTEPDGAARAIYRSLVKCQPAITPESAAQLALTDQAVDALQRVLGIDPDKAPSTGSGQAAAKDKGEKGGEGKAPADPPKAPPATGSTGA